MGCSSSNRIATVDPKVEVEILFPNRKSDRKNYMDLKDKWRTFAKETRTETPYDDNDFKDFYEEYKTELEKHKISLKEVEKEYKYGRMYERMLRSSYAETEVKTLIVEFLGEVYGRTKENDENLRHLFGGFKTTLNDFPDKQIGFPIELDKVEFIDEFFEIMKYDLAFETFQVLNILINVDMTESMCNHLAELIEYQRGLVSVSLPLIDEKDVGLKHDFNLLKPVFEAIKRKPTLKALAIGGVKKDYMSLTPEVGDKFISMFDNQSLSLVALTRFNFSQEQFRKLMDKVKVHNNLKGLVIDMPANDNIVKTYLSTCAVAKSLTGTILFGNENSDSYSERLAEVKDENRNLRIIDVTSSLQLK